MKPETPTTEAKHTPGPWEIDFTGKHIQIYSNIGTLIVDRIATRERQPKNDSGKFSIIEQANARLIAARLNQVSRQPFTREALPPTA